MEIGTAIKRTGIKDSHRAAAQAMGLSPSGLAKRLSGEVEFRPTELARLRLHLQGWLVEASPADLMAAAVELRRLWLEKTA